MRFPERIDADDEGFRDYDDQADESAIDRYLLDKEYAYEPWNFQLRESRIINNQQEQ